MPAKQDKDASTHIAQQHPQRPTPPTPHRFCIEGTDEILVFATGIILSSIKMACSFNSWNMQTKALGLQKEEGYALMETYVSFKQNCSGGSKRYRLCRPAAFHEFVLPVRIFLFCPDDEPPKFSFISLPVTTSGAATTYMVVLLFRHKCLICITALTHVNSVSFYKACRIK